MGIQLELNAAGPGRPSAVFSGGRVVSDAPESVRLVGSTLRVVGLTRWSHQKAVNQLLRGGPPLADCCVSINMEAQVVSALCEEHNEQDRGRRALCICAPINPFERQPTEASSP